MATVISEELDKVINYMVLLIKFSVLRPIDNEATMYLLFRNNVNLLDFL